MAILTVENLGIRFGGLNAVNNFDLEINNNELIGLIGPNGAGKTTVFNMLTGVYKPTTGIIKIHDEVLNGLPTYEIASKHIARTFQNIRLFKDMSVIDNVKVGFNYQTEYRLFDSIFQTAKYKRIEMEINEEAMEMLKVFRLDTKAEQLAKNLSYGDQRRLEIARALAAKPRLLLLDEPAAGMNPQETAELAELIKWIKNKFKISILLIEHDMKLVMNICQNIVVLCFGETIAKGVPEQIQNDTKVIEAYIGRKKHKLVS